jgi:hypothetical protein
VVVDALSGDAVGNLLARLQLNGVDSTVGGRKGVNANRLVQLIGWGCRKAARDI